MGCSFSISEREDPPRPTARERKSTDNTTEHDGETSAQRAVQPRLTIQTTTEPVTSRRDTWRRWVSKFSWPTGSTAATTVQETLLEGEDNVPQGDSPESTASDTVMAEEGDAGSDVPDIVIVSTYFVKLINGSLSVAVHFGERHTFSALPFINDKSDNPSLSSPPHSAQAHLLHRCLLRPQRFLVRYFYLPFFFSVYRCTPERFLLSFLHSTARARPLVAGRTLSLRRPFISRRANIMLARLSIRS
jgi:hypothetical protein